MSTATLISAAGSWSGCLRACWARLQGMGRRAPRRLRLCETLALGERRFVAVLEFEQTRFLLGGTASSLVVLARLEGPQAPPEASRSAQALRIDPLEAER